MLPFKVLKLAKAERPLQQGSNINQSGWNCADMLLGSLSNIQTNKRKHLIIYRKVLLISNWCYSMFTPKLYSETVAVELIVPKKLGYHTGLVQEEMACTVEVLTQLWNIHWNKSLFRTLSSNYIIVYILLQKKKKKKKMHGGKVKSFTSLSLVAQINLNTVCEY